MTSDHVLNILQRAATTAYNWGVEQEDEHIKTVALRIKDELKRRK